MSDELSIPQPGYGGARRHRGGMDPDTLRLLKIAGLIGGGVALVVAGSAVLRHRSNGGEVPVIQADTKPVRFKPENPGGLQVPGMNNEILAGGGDGTTSKLAPAPEAPDLKALTAPPPPVIATPPVVAATPAPVAPPAVAKLAPAAPVPASKPAPAAVPAPVPAAVEKKPAPAPATGKPATVQLAAVSSEAAAKTEWQTLTHKYPELLTGHQPTISKTERDGKTFWRVRTTGFADVAQARTFCEKVRAKGGGCTVADF